MKPDTEVDPPAAVMLILPVAPLPSLAITLVEDMEVKLAAGIPPN